MTSLEVDKFNGGINGVGLVPVKSFEAFIRGLEEGLKTELKAQGADVFEEESCHSLSLTALP